ncbi:MAG: hypothetical protein AAGH41_02180 [Pseudomonadota bacterium]
MTGEMFRPTAKTQRPQQPDGSDARGHSQGARRINALWSGTVKRDVLSDHILFDRSL